MPENDDVVYHSADRESRQTLDNIHRLVTLERSQKLDLLIHLINNLSQPLVICGPDGIGKTTLLDVLQAHQQAHWRICRIEGSAQLSFERLNTQLQQQLADVEGESLSDKLSHLDDTPQKVVWIIDNAGFLVPGLISSLIQFARRYDCLRLVLVLTHDELHLKNSSDPDISDCHLIEIPPLSLRHYTAFLQNLSAGQGAMISFNAINDGLVENLYKKTHGIPGKIIEELPRLSHYKPASSLAWGGSALIVAGLLVAGGLMVWHKPETTTKQATDISETLYKKRTVDISVATPVIQAPVSPAYQPEPAINSTNVVEESAKTPIQHDTIQPLAEAPGESDNQDNGVGQAAVVVDDGDNGSVVNSTNNETTAIQKPAAENDVSVPATIQQETQAVALQNTAAAPDETPLRVEQKNKPEKPEPPKKTEKPVDKTANQQKPAIDVAQKTPEDTPPAVKKVSPKPEPIVAHLTGKDWLKSRNPKHYTLQIMVLSQHESAEKLIRKYPSQQKNMHYFAVQKQGTTKYVVVLGDYPSRSAAKRARKRLPKPLSKAWIRSFRVLQQQNAG
ncbi:SPOR domain-containing protein [methane-oxidizing endosymbiont of Gigantopelta aegis]|uniref:SPOR domain-containing protein n=1 Tax=methane-oxidizing endosymbiont of Gigantopelta aegis TaxID=2794938 RepID=UPI0018DAFAFD|nr:SPOR domain-containing protein [methane-oxidizing endosymbiont of Gigantopelta aegis]